jgi:hypothetical protein
MLMPTMLVLPWLWTGQPRPEKALLFASRFDSTGFRQGWRLFTGGIRLYFAALRAPGALGVSLRGYPVSGHYYSLSLWKDQQSLLAFAHQHAHTNAVASMAELGPAHGVLVSRDADSRQRPTWPDTTRWLATVDPGRYQHQPGPAGPDSVAPAP